MLSLIYQEKILTFREKQQCCCSTRHLSHSVPKPTKWPMLPTKTQISLGNRTVWSEPSLSILWIAKDPMLRHVDSEDSDQTVQVYRLIWVFPGLTCHFVGRIWSFSKVFRCGIKGKGSETLNHNQNESVSKTKLFGAMWLFHSVIL